MIGLGRLFDGVHKTADRWHSSSADDEIDLVGGGDFDERKRPSFNVQSIFVGIFF
jgi:hypothetical protein